MSGGIGSENVPQAPSGSIVVGHDGSSDAQYALATALEFAEQLTAPVVVVRAWSRDARMLVVGSRGLGGLAGMLLGSVSEQCVRHAACPILVARPPR